MCRHIKPQVYNEFAKQHNFSTILIHKTYETYPGNSVSKENQFLKYQHPIWFKSMYLSLKTLTSAEFLCDRPSPASPNSLPADN